MMEKFDKFIDEEIMEFGEQPELDCLACSTVTRETWENHIKKSSHIVAHKQFDLIFDIIDDIVRCKFCNVDLSREACKEHTKIHYIIPWDKVEDQYDRYEIFFGNSILEWKNTFHCCLCEITCVEWSTALVHITNTKHQTLRNESRREFDNLAEITENDVSYRLLVNEGLLARSATSVECVFCKSQSVSIKSVVRHVQGLAHICNRAKFVMMANVETDTMTSGSQENGECRNYEWVNQGYNEEIKNSLNNDETDNRKSNKASTNGSQRNGRDSISSLNMNELYIPPTDCEKSSSRNCHGNFIEPTDTSLEGSSEEAILESQGLHDIDGNWADCREIWIVPIGDGHSHCVICNLSFSSSPAHKTIHLAGKFHDNSRKLHGCDEIEMHRPGEYCCRCCDEEFESLEDVHLHVRTSRHSDLSNRRIVADPPSGKNNGRSERDMFRGSPKHLPSCYVVKISADSFCCVICDLDVLFTSAGVNEHVEGKLHAASLNRYGCRSILRISYTGYYCGYCNLKISSCEKLYDHIKGDAHLGLLEVAKPKRSTKGIGARRNQPNLAEKLSPLGSLKGISKPKKVPQSLDEVNSIRSKEEIPMSEDIKKFRKDFIVELSDKGFRCILCDCQVLPTSGNFDDHVEQIAHREAINIYGCDQISFEEDDTYFCKACNVDLSDFEAVCHHVKASKHVKSLAASTSSINNNMKNHQNYWPEKKDYYVTVGNDLTAFCQICECSLSSSVCNISHHTMGKRHAKSLLKYGCENIIQADDGSYYCKCCDARINDLENVFLHVKASSHCNFVKVAKSQPSDPHSPPMKSKLTKKIDAPSTKKAEISRTKNLAQRRLEDIKNDNVRHAQSTGTPEKFNSNDIVLLGDNKYYCNYCSCMINGYEGMNLHSKGKKHLATKSLHLLKDSLRDGKTQK